MCGLAVDEPIGANGTTPLHYAVSGKHQECVGLLISYGANVNSVMTSEEVCHTNLQNNGGRGLVIKIMEGGA